MDFSAAAATPPATTASTAAPNGRGHSFFWSGDDFSFGDVLDVINPLQHIPVVGTIYRSITGEHIGHLPQLLGDTLFGGVTGAISAVVNIATQEITGKDIGENVMAMLGMEGSGTTQLASASGGATPARPQLVGITRTAMDPDDRRGDVSGGFDYGQAAAPAVLNPMLASVGPASGSPLPAAATGSPSSSGAVAIASAPAGGTLAAAMLSADAAVAAGLGGLDTSAGLMTVSPAFPGVLTGPGPGPAGAASTYAANATAGVRTVASGTAALPAGQGAGAAVRPLSSSQGGTVRSVSGQMLSNHAVPLSVPSTLLGGMRRAGGSATTAPSNNFSSGAGTTPGPNAPVDVSQRMIDALDRYNQMEAARKAAASANAAPTLNSEH